MGDRYSGRSPIRRGPPIRDRVPPRDRDDHPNVEYFGAGESYRPGGQTGDGPYRPVRERDNDRWNPTDRDRDRRDERRRDDIDSYIPPTSIRAQRNNRSRSPPPYRRRSRSPPGRGRQELFPERSTRSPPPPSRRFSPQRSDRARSPIRRRSRSPYAARARSPDGKRARDFSPDSRRSPKRERHDSPPRSRGADRARSPPRRPSSPERAPYRARSRSPPRRDDARPTYADERWRRRSPSPKDSANTSRRSSPPGHQDRVSLVGSRTHSPARGSRYDDRGRDDGYTSRPRSPRRDVYSERERPRERSRESRDRDEYASPAPPSGPRAAGYNRPSQSRPTQPYSSQPTSPPPSSSNASVSAHNRSSTFAPPSGPRGSGPPRDFVSPPGAVRGRTSLTYRAPGYRPPLPNHGSFDSPPPPIPPSGPRAASYSSRGDHTTSSRGSYSTAPSRASPGSNYAASSDFPFRPSMNNSSSATYPRSQRFNTGPSSLPTGPSSVTTTFNKTLPSASTASPVTPATPANFVKSQLNTLERVVPGGRHVPGSAQSVNGLTAEQEKKVKGLEEDAERIRTEIVEKQKVKRDALRDWEVREREAHIAGLRSELAENHLHALGEEDSIMIGAAF